MASPARTIESGTSLQATDHDASRVDTRVQRLSNAAARRVIEPDTDLIGELGPGQIIPDELLSVAGLGLDLTAEQRATLSREEVASITDAGIRFEAVLEAGFAMEIANHLEVDDPRMVFLLHEMGEETRHQRLFIRLHRQLAPEAGNPLNRPLFKRIGRWGTLGIISHPALLYSLVLAGEEIPDMFQKKAAEHPGSDDFLRRVNEYHRQEEARHLSFAKAVLPEVWKRATRADRLAVRYLAPRMIRGMFDTLVHPGVYAAVGLPTWATWRAVKDSPTRVAFRHEATRPVLQALLDARAILPGAVPEAWRSLCGVDRRGRPVASA